MKKQIIYLFKICVIVTTIIGCSEDTIDNLKYGIIKGVVTDVNTGLGIENVKISTNPTSNTILTDVDGNFTLIDVVTGDYAVEAKKNGYITSFEGVSIAHGASVNLIFELDPEEETNLSPLQPVLISPEDNSVENEVNLTLVWSSSDPEEDELTYKIELRNDEDATVEEYEVVADTTLAITGLGLGIKYFWQVSANDDVNPEVWSNVSSFETKVNPEHRFLFTRNISGNDVIFSGDASTGEVVELQITSSSTNSWRPRKNRNNELIAFLRNVGSETHLFSMKPDGSDVFQITGTIPLGGFDLGEIDFCWSDNGDRILYTYFDKLYMINKDGSGLTLVYQTLDGSFISECDWSVDETMIALKTNDLNGYNVSIYTIDMSGTILVDVLSGVLGAAGGINFSVDNNLLLYCHDVSGFESPDYRQLDTQMFIYDFSSSTVINLSADKPVGFLDLDPRFSPNEADVVFTQTSNDGISERTVMKIEASTSSSRELLFNNADMPDWE